MYLLFVQISSLVLLTLLYREDNNRVKVTTFYIAFRYRLNTVNSNTVNSKFHLNRSFYEVSVNIFSNISCLKCTVNSNFHFIQNKTLLYPTCINVLVYPEAAWRNNALFWLIRKWFDNSYIWEKKISRVLDKKNVTELTENNLIDSHQKPKQTRSVWFAEVPPMWILTQERIPNASVQRRL